MRLLLAAGMAFILNACSTLDYYAQSVNGQLDVLTRRQPINRLLQDDTLTPQLRDKLETVLRIRHFASVVLELPDNGSYTSYVQLERPFVVWNVFAAPEFSLQPMEWCFPVAGCVRYRGYFRDSAARDYASGLAAAGYDTYVGGSAAYSTLGWFDDPVFSSLIGLSNARLAGVIFHELAHQKLYIEDDTAFNEGFAMTVELEGVAAWLRSNADAAEAAEYAVFLARQEDFVALVQRTHEQLQTLYESGATPGEKRRGKARLFAAMRSAYEKLKTRWGGYDGYDAWFADGLNNAKLAALSTYRDYVPWFRQLFRQTGGDFAAFYRAAARIGALPQAQRLERLQQDDAWSACSQSRPCTGRFSSGCRDGEPVANVIRDGSAGPSGCRR
jgi:predicted aminopeptidase